MRRRLILDGVAQKITKNTEDTSKIESVVAAIVAKKDNEIKNNFETISTDKFSIFAR